MTSFLRRARPTISTSTFRGNRSPPLPIVTCWRCHKEATAGLANCPYCEGRLSHPSRRAATEVRPTDASPIVTLCVAFSLLLGVSIVQAVLMFGLDDAPDDAESRRLYVMLVAEAIDTVVLVGTWSIMRQITVSRRPTASSAAGVVDRSFCVRNGASD